MGTVLTVRLSVFVCPPFRKPGEANCIADCLSRRPEWMTDKNRQSDSKDSNEDGAGAPRDELCLRIFTESMPFLRDNPALKRLEDICKKDNDYMTILNHIRASKSFRDLPPSSEGSKIGGEWAKLRVLDKFEIVVLRESDSVSKIFPPVAYRAHIMEELHPSGKKEDSIFLRVRMHYTWPNIKKDVRSHVESYKKCAELMPSKPQARP